MTRKTEAIRAGLADRVAAFEGALRRTGTGSPDRLLLKLYTAEETAELLGLTLGMVRKLTCLRDLPCVKIGRRGVRYRALDLLAWEEARSQPAGDGPRLSRADFPGSLTPEKL